jgi:hypothetical protein
VVVGTHAYIIRIPVCITGDGHDSAVLGENIERIAAAVGRGTGSAHPDVAADGQGSAIDRIGADAILRCRIRIASQPLMAEDEVALDGDHRGIGPVTLGEEPGAVLADNQRAVRVAVREASRVAAVTAKNKIDNELRSIAGNGLATIAGLLIAEDEVAVDGVH